MNSNTTTPTDVRVVIAARSESRHVEEDELNVLTRVDLLEPLGARVSLPTHASQMQPAYHVQQ